ncbi:MipA/OmpV family protein [Paraburkholderia terricola]|uniref:Outer membrane scaffolding protein for murein synthesis (MipA/OmpV family) n=1 Tax=Paraburkholderia terricola TaxID=169427 RepID=A0ABU1M1C3_9BURK|nr:MipA/OmpV family protein [Paraburkholderia terricola]MDR6412812.1 outer membrane scaffolding protein for murein synthesis (MipA/OmpV family) [Paraburkholderia terricola]MDR6484916.1 outer membrane scaffolding protein for murein synthesis (MipA/OmpV family) [Paraburkholderia terricola]
MGDSQADAAGQWKIGIGPGIMVAPTFPGSSSVKAYPLPAQDISWNNRVFSQGPDVLGINVLRGKDYHVGSSISLDFQSRTSSDDPRLHGLPNVHCGPKLRLFADYTWWAFTGSAAMYQDIGGTGQGRTVTTDLVASVPVGRLLLSIGPGFTWADAQYTRTFFGITAVQSAASHLPQYQTGSGIRDVHMNVDATYDFSRRWSSALALTAGRLERYAAASPITESRFELTAVAAVSYRF